MPTKDAPKRTLPAGHPQAGYVGPDLSFTDGIGARPDEEQDAYDEMVAEHQAEVDAVTDAEDKIATAEVIAAEKAQVQQEAAVKAQQKPAAAPKAAS